MLASRLRTKMLMLTLTWMPKTLCHRPALGDLKFPRFLPRNRKIFARFARFARLALTLPAGFVYRGSHGQELYALRTRVPGFGFRVPSSGFRAFAAPRAALASAKPPAQPGSAAQAGLANGPFIRHSSFVIRHFAGPSVCARNGPGSVGHQWHEFARGWGVSRYSGLVRPYPTLSGYFFPPFPKGQGCCGRANRSE